MTDDEYRELVEAARDALHDLLVETEPGAGMSLHWAYNQLKETLKKTNEPDSPPATVGDGDAPWDGGASYWHKVCSVADRDREVLEILASEPLTIREVTERLRRSTTPICACT
jgi:hypothetical protein